MKIRPLKYSDADQLASLGKDFWEESEMSFYGEYDSLTAKVLFFNGFKTQLVGWGVEKEGEIVSAIIFKKDKNIWNDKLQLSELAWFSKKEERKSLLNIKMIKEAEKFAKQNNISYLVMGRIKGPESYDKLDHFYKRQGYMELEQIYVKKYE